MKLNRFATLVCGWFPFPFSNSNLGCLRQHGMSALQFDRLDSPIHLHYCIKSDRSSEIHGARQRRIDGHNAIHYFASAPSLFLLGRRGHGN